MLDSAYKKLKRIKNATVGYRITTVVGAWVFYFLLAVVPLAFLLISAFNLFDVDLSGIFVSRLPEEFKEAAFAIFSTAEKVSGGITVFFAFTVITSTYALISQMIKDGEFIYGRKRKGKSRLPNAVFALAFLALLFFVFVFAAAVFTVFGYMFIPSSVARSGRAAPVLLFSALLIILCYLILIFLNKFISPVKIPIKLLSVGALISLFIIVFGTVGFIVYIRFFSNYNAFYGSLAAIVVFLLWTYILMLGICSGSVIISKGLKEDGEK